jgi:hypothetical protein
MAVPTKTYGQVAYEAYAKQVKADYAATVTDPRWPAEMHMRVWENLPPNLRETWYAVAEAVRLYERSRVP